MELDIETILIKSDEVVFRIIDNEAFIIHIDAGSSYGLNEVGTAIWKMIDGMHSLWQIINQLSEEYKADNEEITRDVLNFTQNLKDIGLLKVGSEVQSFNREQ